MDACRDAWMHAGMHGWMQGCMDGCMHECMMDTCGWMDACMDVCYVCMNVYLRTCTHIYMFHACICMMRIQQLCMPLPRCAILRMLLCYAWSICVVSGFACYVGYVLCMMYIMPTTVCACACACVSMYAHCVDMYASSRISCRFLLLPCSTPLH